MGCTVTSDLLLPPKQRAREHGNLTKSLDLVSSLQLFISCMHGCGCACGCVCVPTCMWEPEDNFWESALSFHHVSPGVQTEVSRLGVKHLHPFRQLC